MYSDAGYFSLPLVPLVSASSASPSAASVKRLRFGHGNADKKSFEELKTPELGNWKYNNGCHQVHQQSAQIEPYTPAKKVVSTFFGRYFAQHPRPHPTFPISEPASSDFNHSDSSPAAAKSSIDLHPPLTVEKLCERLQNITVTNSAATSQFLPESWKEEEILLATTSTKPRLLKDAETSAAEERRLMGYLLKRPVCVESSTQTTAEADDDWSWYPWRADSLRYPVDANSGETFRVHAVAMIDPRCICFVRDDNGTYNKLVSDLSEEMGNLAESGRLLTFTSFPPEDSVVCAWDNEQWSRGLILEIYAEKALVLFLDHGTCGELKLNEIRQMKMHWLKIPRCALCVELEGVHSPPSGFFSAEAITAAEELLMEHKVTGTLTISTVRRGDFVGKFVMANGKSFEEMCAARSIL